MCPHILAQCREGVSTGTGDNATVEYMETGDNATVEYMEKVTIRTDNGNRPFSEVGTSVSATKYGGSCVETDSEN